jgi:hypothetical protein
MASVSVTPQLETLAQAIQTQEGYFPGSVSYTDNNPGNLIYAGQPGATAGPNGFAVFDSYQDGLNALYNQLGLYAAGTCGACGGQPLTISQMTAIYAPAGQGSNDPNAYADNLASALGVTPDTLLSDAIAGTGSSSDDTDTNTDLSSLGDLTGSVTIAGVEIPTLGLYAGLAVVLGALWLATRG